MCRSASSITQDNPWTDAHFPVLQRAKACDHDLYCNICAFAVVQDVIARMRVDLKMDLSQATAAVRANGMSVGQNSLTSVLPKPPQLPTFATRSDTDFAMKKETKMRMVRQPMES